MSALSLSGRRVAKNTAAQAVSLVLGTLTFAVAAVAVARTLGPQGLGVFSPAWQLAITLSVVALLGLDQRLIRELNRGRGRAELRATLVVATTIGCLVAAGTFAVLLAGGAAQDTLRAFGAAGLYVAVSAPTFVLRAALHARERMELETVTITAEGVVALAAIWAALALGGGPAAVIAGLVAGRAVGLVTSAVLARRLWNGGDRGSAAPRWTELVRSSLPLGISFTFTTMVLRLDIVLVGTMRPAREAGLYGAAAVITFAIPLLVTSLTRSLYPVLSRASDLDDPELRQVFGETWRVLLALGIGTAALLTVAARPLLVSVYGADFAAAAPALAVLAWLLPIRFVNALCAATLNATAWKRGQTAWLLAVVALNLAANVVLIPIYGYQGAIAAAIGTETILAVVLVSAVWRVRPPVVAPLGLGAAAGLLAAAAAGWIPGHGLVRAGAGAVIVASLALGTGGLRLLAGARASDPLAR